MSKQDVLSYNQLAEILDRISDGFVALDNNWCYTYINKKAAEIANRDPSELIGKNIWEEFPALMEEPRIAYNAYMDAWKSQKTVSIENYYPPYEKWFESQLYPSPDGLSIYFRDVTEKKKTEEGMRLKEQKYRSLVEQASDGIVIVDPSLYYIEVNNRFCQMLGYTRDELLKMSVVDITAIDAGEMPLQFKEMETGKSIVQERKFRKKDGSLIPVEISGSLIWEGNYMGIIRDISERKRAEHKLQESENRLRTILENEPECVKLLNQKGEIIEMNPAGLSMIEADDLEIVKGRSVMEIIDESYRNAFSELTKKVFSGESQTLAFEITGLKGTKRWLETHSVPLKNSEGEIISLLGVTRDITDRKKEQELIKSTNEQLRQLTGHLQTIREEERSRIGQEIHDQLGQHLTVLKMDVSRLRKNIPEGKNKEQDLVEIISELDNCMQMVRKISSDLRPGIIDDLGLVAALEWQSEDFEKRTEIRTRFSSNISELKLPQTHSIGLFRIFQESLTNVARHADAKKVAATLNLENGFVMLTICDDGKGFDKEKNSGKRSLGLLGMRERTFLMNGHYEISSSPGKGTEVKVSVPV